MAEDRRIQQRATGVGDHLPAKDDPAPPPTPGGTDGRPSIDLTIPNVPWSGAEIIAVLCVGSLWPGLVNEFLQRVGWYRWF